MAVVGALTLLSLPLYSSVSWSNNFLNKPDGTLEKMKEGTYQPDLSAFRSRLDARMLDRRWVTADAMALANEAFFIGQSGFNDMVRLGFPLAHKPEFQWVTHQESYWYARYNMGHTMGLGHMGIHMVQGPYWTLKALELNNKNKVVRDRGERIPSNKDVMLGYYMPMYYKRIGIPRPFDDPQPAYLMFESGDPHFTSEAVASDTYFDPQSQKMGKWGMPEYFWNTRYARWDQDKQSRYIDMGGDGMTMKRGSMWIAYMFKQNRTAASPSSQGFAESSKQVKAQQVGYEDGITMLGNDPEEGFRGMILVTSNANRLLAWKSQLVADEQGNLGGINPYEYEPSKGFRYFPHRIWPNMMSAGDLPERQWAFDINDPRSLLYDQAAMLLGVTEYYHQTYRLPEVFSANPPVDGGIVERDLGIVARGVANMLVKNMTTMHINNGLLVSEWQPKTSKFWVTTELNHAGPGEIVSVRDSAYAIKALREYVDRMRDPSGNPKSQENADLEPELTKNAETLLRAHAEFMLKVQEPSGAYCASYRVTTAECLGDKTLSEPSFWAIAALTTAYHATGQEKYAEAARKTWNYVNTQFWYEPSGLFRTRLGDDTVYVTPVSMAAQLWAYREIMFATPAHLIEPLIDRWTRWWVQTMDMTGLIQSEENRSGELCHGVCSKDFDNDGIPSMRKAHGRYGVAPVFASRIAVNLGGAKNKDFAKVGGDVHDPEMYGGKIKYHYTPKTQERALSGILLPVKLDTQYDKEGQLKAPWITRDKMTRFDGITYMVPPAIPITRGSSFTGRQLVEMNCAHCHGYTGEGITGIPWKDDSLHRTREDMFEVPKNGRFTRLMPEWGRGLGDDFGSVLTDEEIYRIVDYVQSKEFQQLVHEDYNGIAHPNMPPKDVYWYISLSYIHGKQTPATEEDIRLIMDAQEQAVKEKRPIDIMALLREAEKGRPLQASDPSSSIAWLKKLMPNSDLRSQREEFKAYTIFDEVLTRPLRVSNEIRAKDQGSISVDLPIAGLPKVHPVKSNER